MAVTQYSDVGITSNPDPRPPFDSSTATVPSNWTNDPQARDITFNATGRRPKVYVRDKNPYKPAGGT